MNKIKKNCSQIDKPLTVNKILQVPLARELHLVGPNQQAFFY